MRNETILSELANKQTEHINHLILLNKLNSNVRGFLKYDSIM